MWLNFNKRLFLPFSFLLLFAFLIPLSSSFVFAQDSYRVDPGQSITIDKHGVCKIVSNQSGYPSTFVPVKTSSEWLEFRIHKPGHITLEDCIFVCADPVTFTYKGVSVTYGTVWNSSTSKCWMDRNLGASQVATAYNNSQAYGDSFQWGRLDDNHQNRNSGYTTTRSSTDNPGHSKFINFDNPPWDWRNPPNNNLWQGDGGINDPCPPGWRVPTSNEWNAERASWSSQNYNGAFASPLKLTAGGYRSANIPLLFEYVGSRGYYWSSSVSIWLGGENVSGVLYFYSNTAGISGGGRAGGFSVRCLMD